MTKQITHEELKILLNEIGKLPKNKPTLFIKGFRGIGKSYSIKEVSKQRAEEKKKIFFDYNNSSYEEKKEALKNAGKYYFFIDIRLSEYDTTDIKGLPKFNDDGEAIEYKTPLWCLVLAHKESDGVLFFDELNLTTPLIMASCYKIIYDRIINENSINEKWLIVAGGNRADERAFTHEIPKPLLDRFNEAELITPSIDDFTNYASKNKFDNRIISFLNFKSSNLFKISDDDDEQKDTTPRGWERVSNLIKGKDDYNILSLLTETAISEGIAKEFLSFCKIKDKINLEELIKNPSRIKGIEDISIKYFLISVVADKYKDKKINFDKIMDISKEFDKINNAEFVALLWRICYNSTEQFKDDFINSVDNSFSEKYARYLN